MGTGVVGWHMAPAGIDRATGREITGDSGNLEIMLDFKEIILEGFSAHEV